MTLGILTNNGVIIRITEFEVPIGVKEDNYPRQIVGFFLAQLLHRETYIELKEGIQK